MKKYEVVLKTDWIEIGCGEFDTMEEALLMQGAFLSWKTIIQEIEVPNELNTLMGNPLEALEALSIIK